MAVSALFQALIGFQILPYFSLSLSKIPHLAGAAATKKRVKRLYLLQRQFFGISSKGIGYE